MPCFKVHGQRYLTSSSIALVLSLLALLLPAKIEAADQDPIKGEDGMVGTPSVKAQGKDYGVMGEVFPIQEKNILEVIMAKLEKIQAEGKIDSYNSQIQKKVKDQMERPQPVTKITETSNPRVFNYDPSITLTQDLKDHQGNVFHHKGEKINPLQQRPMTKPLLFIDGDKSQHLTWAFSQLKKYPLAKVILVNGAPMQIMQEMGIQVYFDQHGKITSKLGIEQVPAIVTQAGDVLKVAEVKADISDIVDARHEAIAAAPKAAS